MTSSTITAGWSATAAAKRLPSGCGALHLEAEVAQGRLEHRSQVLFVVDEQQTFSGHDPQHRTGS